MHSALPKMTEPFTAMTKATGITFCTSKVSHGRHKSQGPMRSEKVYHMTKVINQKCVQLEYEQAHIKQHYTDIDNAHDYTKSLIQQQYGDIKTEKVVVDQIAKDKQKELEDLDIQQEKLRAAQQKMLKDLEDHIRVV